MSARCLASRRSLPAVSALAAALRQRRKARTDSLRRADSYTGSCQDHPSSPLSGVCLAQDHRPADDAPTLQPKGHRKERDHILRGRGIIAHTRPGTAARNSSEERSYCQPRSPFRLCDLRWGGSAYQEVYQGAGMVPDYAGPRPPDLRHRHDRSPTRSASKSRDHCSERELPLPLGDPRDSASAGRARRSYHIAGPG